MRSTPGYMPLSTPWGELIEFDQVTASLRKCQLRLDRLADECPGLEFNHDWLVAYSYIKHQIALCALSFERYPETLPSGNAIKLAGDTDVK